MAYEILETRELAAVLENIPPVSNYWLSLCFPRAYNSESEKIDFDIVDQGRRLAPFVAPNVQGQPMLSERRDIRSFTPAYIKPKDAVDPRRVLQRRAGEAYGGSLQSNPAPRLGDTSRSRPAWRGRRAAARA